MRPLSILLLSIASFASSAQPCYVWLYDPSGLNTNPGQDSLSSAACALRAVLPEEFQSQFKVLDFGFYLHQERFQEGFTGPFEQKIQAIAAMSPYFLAFGRQIDQKGICTKFWVELKLPSSGRFSCMSEMERRLLNAKAQAVANRIYSDLGATPAMYAQAETGTMDTLKNRIEHIINCCYAKSDECNQCLGFEDNDQLFQAEGFDFSPVSVQESNTAFALFDEQIVKNYACQNYLVLLPGQTKTIGQLIGDFLENEVDDGETAMIIVTTEANFCNQSVPCSQLDYGAIRSQFQSSTARRKKWLHLYDTGNSPADGLYTLKDETGDPDKLEAMCVVFRAHEQNPSGWIRIRKDGVALQEISGDQHTLAWSKTPEGDVLKKPAAYVSGNIARISAAFRVEGSDKQCPDPFPINAGKSTHFARGTCENLDGVSLPIAQLQIRKGIYYYPASSLHQGGAPFIFTPKQVRYFEHFRIKWEVASSAEGPWKEAGVSEHRLYVTRNKPINSQPVFYTCLHTGCKSANQNTDETEIVKTVYKEFKTLCIKKAEDESSDCLTYWKTSNAQFNELPQFLENNDASCGTWYSFMADILKIQGIMSLPIDIRIVGYNPVGLNNYLLKINQKFGALLFQESWINNHNLIPVDGGNLFTFSTPNLNVLVVHGQRNGASLNVPFRFFVKNWNLPVTKQFYADKLITQAPTVEIGEAVIPSTKLSGVNGQGDIPPILSHFNDHSILCFPASIPEGRYFDPSYGSGPINGFPDKLSRAEQILNGFGPLLIYFPHNPEENRQFILYQEDVFSSSNTNDILKFNGQ